MVLPSRIEPAQANRRIRLKADGGPAALLHDGLFVFPDRDALRRLRQGQLEDVSGLAHLPRTSPIFDDLPRERVVRTSCRLLVEELVILLLFDRERILGTAIGNGRAGLDLAGAEERPLGSS